MQNAQETEEANNQITSSSAAQMDHEMKSSEFAGQASSLIEEDAQMETNSASGGSVLTKKAEDPSVAQIEIKKKEEDSSTQ